MTEQAKRFAIEVQGNEALKAKLKVLEESVQGKAPEDVRNELIVPLCTLAKEYGYELSEADFESTGEALNDDELEALAGGSCLCPLLGGGAGNDRGIFVCGCLIAGASMSDDLMQCMCILGGSGD